MNPDETSKTHQDLFRTERMSMEYALTRTTVNLLQIVRDTEWDLDEAECALTQIESLKRQLDRLNIHFEEAIK